MPKRQPSWQPAELEALSELCTPQRIQAFLDSVPYNDELTCRSPRRVLRDRKAHCFEGALLAAAALSHHGRPALLVDLRAARGRDDDHVIVLFREHGCLGAVAKSNFSGLRYRSPVYKTLRELAMSYFENYYNLEAELTLRSYSSPLELTDRLYPGWQTAEEDLDALGERLDARRHWPLITEAMARALRLVDRRQYDAGLMGSNPDGLFRT